MWKVKFIYREVNVVAHRLAKFTISYDVEHVWLEEGPSILTSMFDLINIVKLIEQQ